jgi:hypothetical protein
MLAGMYGGLSHEMAYGWKLSMLYAVGATPLGALIAGQVGKIRDQFAKSAEIDPAQSPELLELLAAVERKLQQQTRKAAYLSLRVAGLDDLRRTSSEARVAATLGDLRAWTLEIIHRHGGTPVGADALLSRFTSEAGAVRAARELQDGMTRFNTDRSLLSSPLRIACGIAAGPAGELDGTADPVEPAITARASALSVHADPGDILVSGEITTAALLELGVLAPASRVAGEEPAFSWRAGQRAQQRP